MINFYELEKRCKKLQQKRLKKRILIVLLLVIVVGMVSWLFINQINKHQEKKEIKKEHKKVIKTAEIKKTEKIEKIEKKIKEEKSEKVKKIEKIEKPKQLKKEENKTIKQEIPIISYTLNLNNIKEVNLSIKQVQVLQGKENNKTVTKEEKNPNSIKTKNLTFDEALNSANLYYKNGNYKETIKWCKIASSLNNENEEVWKLYSLSLERLGNRNKAIKVLKTYLKYKNSTELKLILERLEK